MRDPSPSTVLDNTVLDSTVLDPPVLPANGDEPVRSNRAARRGRSGKQAHTGAVHTGSTGRARAAQGRRINPVRRTG